MNTKQPQTIEPPGRIPASGRDGRDWGLEIADWGFANGRSGQFANAVRQTNPIGAGGTSAIADCGFGIGDCGEPETGDLSALRQTNPITLYVVVPILPGHYISRARRGERRTKPIRAAGGRDWGLGIADWGFEDARCAGLVWTEYQTKPILAEETSALIMDKGLLMNQDHRHVRV